MMIFFCAACSCKSTLSLTSRMIFSGPLPAWLAGSTFSLTTVPLAPLIFLTTSLIRQPITSTISPLSPWPTPTILSPFFSRLLLNAGPPGMISFTTVYSFSVWSFAPMPSSERLMSI